MRVELSGICLRRGGRTVLEDVDWILEEGASAALVGPNGAGKSSLLEVLAGLLWPAAGQRRWLREGWVETSPLAVRDRVALVSGEMLATYRQRGVSVSVREVIGAGFFRTPFLYQPLTFTQAGAVEDWAARLGIPHLVDEDLLTLSLGQAKRALLARALAPEPELLLLDEFGDGLDGASLAAGLATLAHVAANGTQLVVAGHRTEEFLPCLSQVLWLDQGRVRQAGGREVVETYRGAMAPEPSGRPAPAPARVRLPPLIRLEEVGVMLEGRQVLHDIAWTIRPGESWMVLGANGAGKSSLLKVLSGDLHPLPGGVVERDGRQRLSLWDIRRRCLPVSFDLQVAAAEAGSLGAIVAGGLYGHLGLYVDPTATEQARVDHWLEVVGLAHRAQQDAASASTGELRRSLLGRALIAEPALLLLDEPLSGLDAAARAAMAALLERLAASGTTLVYATHRPAERVAGIHRLLVLEAGRVVYQGAIADAPAEILSRAGGSHFPS